MVECMTPTNTQYAVREFCRFERTSTGVRLQTTSHVIEMTEDTFVFYQKLSESLRDERTPDESARHVGVSAAQLSQFARRFADAGLLVAIDGAPGAMSGEQFHRDCFSPALDGWLRDAFSHPFWERMRSGAGSKRLFAGWLFELYHYTKNANRHMPLSCAYAELKGVKTLRAKHYAEEWNHYHYFAKSLAALGYGREAVAVSEPLPMTLEMSNFMRQAARDDVLAYSVCSAVLEGTTIGDENFRGYYDRCAELYAVPIAAIQPIYDHLDLDKKYQHSDLFLDILRHVPVIEPGRVEKILGYGRQLCEHIWLWTDEIERYYSSGRPVPRTAFNMILD
jgi:hypothetical protein